MVRPIKVVSCWVYLMGFPDIIEKKKEFSKNTCMECHSTSTKNLICDRCKFYDYVQIIDDRCNKKDVSKTLLKNTVFQECHGTSTKI